MIDNADLQVINLLKDWLSAGDNAWLCTVVKTWGSSPRPVGSVFACNQHGHTAGSLSGGCVEDDLIEKLIQGKVAAGKPETMIYGATDEDVEKFNLPCGGQLHIVIEPVTDPAAGEKLGLMAERLSARSCVKRTLNLNTGDVVVEPVERFSHLTFSGPFAKDANDEDRLLVQTFGPRFQIFAIGAGQVSMYLAQMALMLDYHVVVCDPRPEVIDQWPVEDVQLVNEMPDDAVRKYADDPFSAVVALTHDPRIDDMGLMEALKTDAFFIGAMGSTRTSAKRRERLKLLDLTDDEISRLHAPVGLSIGSKTPAEIAIAILAELTQVRSTAASEATKARLIEA
ncbi:MAG: XdhC family protein [Pseudomonadales bacterium]|nr:XdhC family protein [Pseudomonadales bacterium]